VQAKISPVDFIFTHFPKEEEIGIDSSRFTTEIKQLKEICDLITPYSMVIMNESLQSTTPDECMSIAAAHMEILSVAGVRGIYVTHLTGLYAKAEEINRQNNKTQFGSLVSVADEKSGERLYLLVKKPPMSESMAYSVFEKFGAKLDDVKLRIGMI
jgi:DNA mismatch repair ATPase MutS